MSKESNGRPTSLMRLFSLKTVSLNQVNLIRNHDREQESASDQYAEGNIKDKIWML
jgi:hypothetical protein